MPTRRADLRRAREHGHAPGPDQEGARLKDSLSMRETPFRGLQVPVEEIFETPGQTMTHLAN